MPKRHYSSVATRMELAAGVNAATTTITVDTVAGLPAQTPFTLVLSAGSATEEVVTVTGVAGTTLTVIRGEDGSSAQAHETGAEVRHMMTARDLREPQQHMAASRGVHGLDSDSDVVGTLTEQVLTNKTIDGQFNTLTNIPQEAVDGLVGHTHTPEDIVGDIDATTIQGRTIYVQSAEPTGPGVKDGDIWFEV